MFGDVRAGELFDPPVCVARRFRAAVQAVRQRYARAGQLALDPQDVLDLVKEPEVDLRDLVNAFGRNAAAQRFIDDEEPLIGRLAQPLFDLVVAQLRQGRQTQGVHADLGAAHGFHQRFLERRRDRHHLAGGLHLRPQQP